MNQRVAVRAIVQRDGKTLLLRRSVGRVSILHKYELPGGKIEYGEQPEDALLRHLKREAGVAVSTTQLFDILTYVDHDDRDIQYVFLLYLVKVNDDKITLSSNYDQYLWRLLKDIHQYELTESTKLLLGISQQSIQPSTKDQLISNEVTKVSDVSSLIVYSDGGSRGNPGPSAAAFIIMNEEEVVLHEGGIYLGVTTNNIAEYHGVRLGLEKALEMGARSVECRIDSMLVVNQMNSTYAIRNRELWPIYDRIKELVGKFERVTFVHVKREFNQLADGMVNKILNAHVESKV